jgi:kynurenine formamidase
MAGRGQGEGQVSDAVDAEEFAALFARCSNWGRWGPDDQRGALNHITPAVVAAATASVRTGVTVSCARVLDTAAAVDNPRPAEHRMTLLPGQGDAAGVRFAGDSLSLHCHGEVHSHLDSLCHVGYRGRLHNGWSTGTVDASGGSVGDLEVASAGIVSRGVLLDIPRLHGERWLSAGYAVGPGELASAAAAARTEIRRGDVLLLRTGHALRRRVEGPWDSASAKAGLHPRAMPWLRDREIGAIGFDGDGDAAPHACGGIRAPIHVLGINAIGLSFLDALDLDELAQRCETEQRWNFLFVVAPLRLRGGTGCAVNPIAVF